MPNYTRRPFTPTRLALQTSLSARRVSDTIKLAARLQEDPDREKRLQQQLCIACHYFHRIAGQAFTDQPCACCAKPQRFSSTATDDLCQPCAEKNKLCKRCSGDIDMRTGRRTWPDGPTAPNEVPACPAA
jgi:hypothetical protein